MQKTVAHILDGKGRAAFSVAADTSVLAALEVMADKNVGAVVVVTDGALVGILSERDYARKVVLHGRDSKATAVSEIMTPNPTTVAADATVQACMELMSERKFRHLPVVQDGDLVGVISIGDVVKAVIEEQKFIIDQLEGYITG